MSFSKVFLSGIFCFGFVVTLQANGHGNLGVLIAKTIAVSAVTGGTCGLVDAYILNYVSFPFGFIIFRQNTPCLSRLGMNGGHLSEQSKKSIFCAVR
jgi:hypothetical protein